MIDYTSGRVAVDKKMLQNSKY
uniref:Uncharacterized protein n=1 Tax=Anguilla anguilla TaxID=7936 RepID=A0A0E9QN28_ANGAN